MKTELSKLVKKLLISEEFAAKIIVYDHELNNYIPKKRLKKIDLNLTGESARYIAKVAKVLKVSQDAVIGMALINYLEKEGPSDTKTI